MGGRGQRKRAYSGGRGAEKLMGTRTKETGNVEYQNKERQQTEGKTREKHGYTRTILILACTECAHTPYDPDGRVAHKKW